MENAGAAEVRKDFRNWGMLCHLSALTLFIGLPFGHIFGPLIIWLIKRNDHPYIDEQGKESLNFQISMSIYALIISPLVFVLIGIPLLIVLALVDLILTIVASVRASSGQAFHYPMAIHFFR